MPLTPVRITTVKIVESTAFRATRRKLNINIYTSVNVVSSTIEECVHHPVQNINYCNT